MNITILSWNIACSGCDAKNGNPLANRIHDVCQRLSAVQKEKNAQIVLIQEIRGTDSDPPVDRYSAAEVAEKIRSALGSDWNVYLHHVNATEGAFYRATLWDSNVIMATCHTPIYTRNSKTEPFAYMALVSDFVAVNSNLHSAPRNLRVVNVHAPAMGPFTDKQLYWAKAGQYMHKCAIAMGDMNKFEEQMQQYTNGMELNFLYDVMCEKTFLSFPYDAKPDGTLYYSCLDAIILHEDSELQHLEMFVESTEATRESDHFIIGATFTYKF